MKYWTAQDWQALLFALAEGVKMGAVWMLFDILRVRTGRWMAALLDGILGLLAGILLIRTLWRGTEGLFRAYIPIFMGVGWLTFRLGPQQILSAFMHRLRKAVKCGTIFPHFKGSSSWQQEPKSKNG